MRSVDFDNEEFKDILHQYEKAVDSGTTVYLDAADFVDIADYYFSRLMYDRAEKVCKCAFSIHPEATSVQVLQANMYLDIYHDTERAKEALDKVDDKTDIEYTYTKVDILLREDKIDEAMTEINAFYESIPEDETESFLLDISELLLDNNQTERAEEWLSRCKNHDDDYLELKGRLHFDKSEWDAAITIFNDLLDRNPYDDRLWCMLAKAQYMTNRMEEACNSCEFAIAIEPERSEAIQIKAFVLFALCNYKDAIPLFTTFLEWFPDDIRSLEFLSYCYINTGDFKQAVPLLEHRLELLEEAGEVTFDIYRELAFAYSETKQIEKALSACDSMGKFPNVYPHNLIVKAQIYLDNNQEKEGLHCLEEAIKNSHGNAEIVADTSLVLIEHHYYDDAYLLMSAMMQNITEDYPKGEACLALCAYHYGKRQQYLTSLKKAVDHDPNLAETLLADLFPKETEPQDYYEYALNNHLIA